METDGKKAEVLSGASEGSWKGRRLVFIPSFLFHGAWSFWTRGLPWRWKQCCKAGRRKLGCGWLCGVAIPALRSHVSGLLCNRIYHPGLGPSYQETNAIPNVCTRVPAWACLDSPSLVSKSRWQWQELQQCLLLFLFLLPQPWTLWDSRDLRNNSLSHSYSMCNLCIHLHS